MLKPEKIVDLFRLLASKTRFKIITLLLASKEKTNVKQIADAVGLTHSATSHQLSKLEDNDIVESERCGQTMCYTLTDSEKAQHIVDIIKTVS